MFQHSVSGDGDRPKRATPKRFCISRHIQLTFAVLPAVPDSAVGIVAFRATYTHVVRMTIHITRSIRTSQGNSIYFAPARASFHYRIGFGGRKTVNGERRDIFRLGEIGSINIEIRFVSAVWWRFLGEAGEWMV